MLRSLIVVVIVTVAAAALGASPARALSAPQSYSLLDVSRNIDEPLGGFTFNRPPQGGDQFTFVDDLYRWAGAKKGAHVGHARGVATFVTGFGNGFSHKATVLFVVQAYLPGGSLLIEGYGQASPNGPSRYVFPVTGGTGIYANARGFIAVRDLGNGNAGKSNVDVRIRP